MIETGELIGIEGRKLQLIRGEVVYMSPPGARHDDIVYRLTTWAYSGEDKIEIPVEISIQLSINLPDQNSVVSPDMAFVVAQSYAARRPVPKDTFLVIEVLDASLKEHEDEKCALYAEASIAEYWAINAPDKTLTVYRNPEGGRYRDAQTLSEQESVQSASVPGLTLPIAELFG